VPALVAGALVAAVLGKGWWGLAGLLIVYNSIRLWTGAWSLRTGARAGMGVGSAIGASWIPRAIAVVGPVAGFAVGAAVPIVAVWYLRGFHPTAVYGAAMIAVAGIAARRYLGPAFTTVRFALGAIGLTLVVQWLIR
jgi:hypothetical protein